MIECSLFSTRTCIRRLCAYLEAHRWRSRVLAETESVYVGGWSRVYVLESRSKIVQRSRYDYNKERRCVCCAVSESAVLGCSDVDGTMRALGFRKEKTLRVDGVLYTHSGVCLEATRTGTGLHGGAWLLVLYARAETAAEGERLVLEASACLRPYAVFAKPSIEWFNRGLAGTPQSPPAHGAPTDPRSDG